MHAHVHRRRPALPRPARARPPRSLRARGAGALGVAAILLALLPGGPLGAGEEEEPVAVSGGLKVVSPKEYAAQAAAAFAKLDDPLDVAALDAFIRDYAESEEASYVFAVRMSYLRDMPLADAYHRFIETYRDRLGARLAIGDLFRLYRRAHRLSGYVDFIRRYPSTPEAQLARLHLCQLAFELACRLDTAADYDAFVQLFPDAGQRVAAETLAEERAITEERARYEAKRAELGAGEALDEWVNGRLRNLVFVHRDLWLAASQPEPPRQVVRFVEGEFLGRAFDPADVAVRHYLAQRVARIYAIVRSIEAYRLHEASDQILAEARHQELIAKLEEIRAELEKQREETARLLREEFERTRRTLEEGFRSVVAEQRLDRAVLAKGFEVLAEGMDRLHADLVAVHRELRGIRVSVDNVTRTIQQSNALLARLDERLAAVNANLRRINVDLNRGLDRVATGIERMHADMNANFDRQAAIALRQLEVAQIQTDIQLETLYTVDHGFRQVDASLRTGFARLEDATWGAASTIADSNRRLASSLGGGGRRKPREAGVLGSLLGTAATFAGAGPILGPVLGDMAGHVIGAVAAGEAVDPLELGRTAVMTAAGKRFKGVHAANRIAGAVYDKAILERRNGYTRTAQAFEARQPMRESAGVAPWPEVAAGASTPAQFDALARRIAETYRTEPGLIEFCATRIH